MPGILVWLQCKQDGADDVFRSYLRERAAERGHKIIFMTIDQAARNLQPRSNRRPSRMDALAQRGLIVLQVSTALIRSKESRASDEGALIEAWLHRDLGFSWIPCFVFSSDEGRGRYGSPPFVIEGRKVLVSGYGIADEPGHKLAILYNPGQLPDAISASEVLDVLCQTLSQLIRIRKWQVVITHLTSEAQALPRSFWFRFAWARKTLECIRKLRQICRDEDDCLIVRRQEICSVFDEQQRRFGVLIGIADKHKDSRMGKDEELAGQMLGEVGQRFDLICNDIRKIHDRISDVLARSSILDEWNDWSAAALIEASAHRMRLMMLGSFSVGKTTLINRMFFPERKRTLRTSAGPNTAAIVFLCYCDSEKTQRVEFIYRSPLEYREIELWENVECSEGGLAENLKYHKDAVEFFRAVAGSCADLINWEKTTLRLESASKALKQSEVRVYKGKIARSKVIELSEELDKIESLHNLQRKYPRISLTFCGNTHEKKFVRSHGLPKDSDWSWFQGEIGAEKIRSGYAESLQVTWFAKEIRLYVNSELLRFIELIDTPGLDSRSFYHDETTLGNLDRADAWLLPVMVDLKAENSGVRKAIEKLVRQCESHPDVNGDGRPLLVCFNWKKDGVFTTEVRALQKAKEIEKRLHTLLGRSTSLTMSAYFMDFLNTPMTKDSIDGYPSWQWLLWDFSQLLHGVVANRMTNYVREVDSWFVRALNRKAKGSGSSPVRDLDRFFDFEKRILKKIVQMNNYCDEFVDQYFIGRCRPGYLMRCGALPLDDCRREDLEGCRNKMLGVTEEYSVNIKKLKQDMIERLRSIQELAAEVEIRVNKVNQLESALAQMPNFSKGKVEKAFDNAESGWQWWRGGARLLGADSNGEKRRSEILRTILSEDEIVEWWNGYMVKFFEELEASVEAAVSKVRNAMEGRVHQYRIDRNKVLRELRNDRKMLLEAQSHWHQAKKVIIKTQKKVRGQNE